MKTNLRRCISCRKIADKSQFLRVVRLPASHAVQVGEGSGRSAYICPSNNCLKLAGKKNRLGRSLKTSVTEEIYRELQNRLALLHADL